jgi:hypothetical protein
METKNYGKIRGGCNACARFFIHIHPSDESLTDEEYAAIFSLWDEEYGLIGSRWCGWHYAINTRREFAVVPVIIRKAQQIGYDVTTSMWDVGHKGEVGLIDNPAEFWQALALAQAFFRE